MIDKRSERDIALPAASRRPRDSLARPCSSAMTASLSCRCSSRQSAITVSSNSDSVKRIENTRFCPFIGPPPFKRLTIALCLFQSARQLRGCLVGLWLPSMDRDGIQEPDTPDHNELVQRKAATDRRTSLGHFEIPERQTRQQMK
jgi:hypothetical protein